MLINESDRNTFDVDFVAEAIKDGVILGHVGQVAKGALPPEVFSKIKAEGMLYRNAFELPAGNYQVRFVVRDNSTGKIGSVSAPLNIN